MAKIKQGILGGFSGSVASITGSSWKGIAVMKSKPLSVANPNTVLQQAQRTSFKSIASLLSVVLVQVVKPVYNPTASKMSGYNLAAKLNKTAFNSAGDFVPENFTLGNGNLVNPKTFANTGGYTLESFDVTFDANVPALSPRLSDKIHGFAYEPISGNIWATSGTATRADGECSFESVVLGSTWVGNRTIYLWAVAVSEDGRQTGLAMNKQELVAALA